MATNAAMVLSKLVATRPRELAQTISDSLAKEEIISSVDIAGPGFINISLSKVCWQNLLSSVLLAGKNFGRSNM